MILSFLQVYSRQIAPQLNREAAKNAKVAVFGALVNNPLLLGVVPSSAEGPGYEVELSFIADKSDAVVSPLDPAFHLKRYIVQAKFLRELKSSISPNECEKTTFFTGSFGTPVKGKESDWQNTMFHLSGTEGELVMGCPDKRHHDIQLVGRVAALWAPTGSRTDFRCTMRPVSQTEVNSRTAARDSVKNQIATLRHAAEVEVWKHWEELVLEQRHFVGEIRNSPRGLLQVRAEIGKYDSKTILALTFRNTATLPILADAVRDYDSLSPSFTFASSGLGSFVGRIDNFSLKLPAKDEISIAGPIKGTCLQKQLGSFAGFLTLRPMTESDFAVEKVENERIAKELKHQEETRRAIVALLHNPQGVHITFDPLKNPWSGLLQAEFDLSFDSTYSDSKSFKYHLFLENKREKAYDHLLAGGTVIINEQAQIELRTQKGSPNPLFSYVILRMDTIDVEKGIIGGRYSMPDKGTAWVESHSYRGDYAGSFIIIKPPVRGNPFATPSPVVRGRFFQKENPYAPSDTNPLGRPRGVPSETNPLGRAGGAGINSGTGNPYGPSETTPSGGSGGAEGENPYGGGAVVPAPGGPSPTNPFGTGSPKVRPPPSPSPTRPFGSRSPTIGPILPSAKEI
ncbi:MAG TPA: hypothetical protein VGO27_23220 [Candidatus Acidoferrum sp.]|nr:hypothetical protein [Candidatus Acidoferrum sp.]